MTMNSIPTRGALACADWFAGKCSGQPLNLAPPSVGAKRPRGHGLDEDENYTNWAKTQLREIWPLERSA